MTLASCPAWNEDRPADLPRIIANLQSLWPLIEADSSTRPKPSVATALEWHRRIYDGVAVPHPDYVGQVRDSDPLFPCLIDYEVAVGSSRAVRARDVPAALDAFVSATSAVVMALDAAVPPARVPSAPPVVAAIVRLCAYAHGEWIRIHPFADGNGRTARIWANWIAVRYGLPPFVRIKPRPDDVLFAGATEMSMRGDHRPTEAMFVAMLDDALRAAMRRP
ncbi:MAG: Fic family protein [Chloroflexi bacterium]|nr:Fic family protein [Chloroflexota bacterium]